MSSVRRDLTRAETRERGQVIVMFALLLPIFLALSGVVIGIGNWYTHGKHLQTKADAGAFAGGTEWEFPCGSQIDARIEATARLYAGSNNPQIGGVPNSSIHTVLNGSAWYDDDSNPAPLEKNSPLNASVCDAKILDVKVTEDNSFPLASLIPLFPDIKRKARIEIQEAEGLSGLLPIAVRSPEPVSAAAVFYNESNGNILAVKYLVKNNSIFNMPGGLQGWSSFNTEDTSTWANFTPAGSTGVLLAVSFRGACNTGLPSPNTKITTTGTPCFEDSGFADVNALCNQGSSTQIVNCYYSTGTWPTESPQSGLHFIRGYGTGNVGNGPPQVRSAWLENVSCLVSGVSSPAYFNAHPNNSCQAKVHVEVDLGSVDENPPPNPPNTSFETRIADNIQVRYGIKRADGSTFCPNMNNNCDLQYSGSPNATGVVDYTSQGSSSSPHALLTANSLGNAIAVEIQVRRSTVVPNPGGCSNLQNGNYNNNCRWFHIGSGISSTSVNPITNNNGVAVLGSPITRAFRGNSLTSGSQQWMRLTTDENCDGVPEHIDLEAASQAATGNRCFFVDVGLKGGLSQNANEQPILFNDGLGSSQMGALDCDPNIAQGQILIDGVIQGCGPWYAPNRFDTVPLCPQSNNIFTQPNPGSPWLDWPPLRCVKTRPTGSMNQIERGFDGRFFDDQNANSCPGGANGGPNYIKGRNYWDKDTTNGYIGTPPLGFAEGTHNTNFHPQDPRIVTIFVTTTEAFTGSGQNTYPITGFIVVYITGYGRISGGGSINIDDPCPGNTPPSDLDLSGGSTGGYAIWGHIIKYTLPSASTTPSGVICNPTGSLTPCVPVLVE